MGPKDSTMLSLGLAAEMNKTDRGREVSPAKSCFNFVQRRCLDARKGEKSPSISPSRSPRASPKRSNSPFCVKCKENQKSGLTSGKNTETFNAQNNAFFAPSITSACTKSSQDTFVKPSPVVGCKLRVTPDNSCIKEQNIMGCSALKPIQQNISKCSNNAKRSAGSVQIYQEITLENFIEQYTNDSKTTAPVILLDCRSFIAFNLSHVGGAINVCASDKLTRRRLKGGSLKIMDLIKCNETKQILEKTDAMSPLVVYDDSTEDPYDPKDVGQSPLPQILSAIAKEGRKAAFLKGGYQAFVKKYRHLCEEQKITPESPLYSPTTPYLVEPAIDTAVASVVLPYLVLGNQRDAADESRLAELGVTHILNVTSNIPMYLEGKSDKLVFKRLPATDCQKQDLKKYFEESFSFIDEAKKSGGKVLIHCQAGVSRSATITIAYLMRHWGLSLNDGYKYVKSKRAIVDPNLHFMGQLQEYQSLLETTDSRRPLAEVLKGEMLRSPSIDVPEAAET